MKSAKEMFEGMGYYIFFKCDDCVWYREAKANMPINVRFNGEEKIIDLWYINESGDRKDVFMTLDLLQAINKQIEELGWSDQNLPNKK